MKDLGEAGTLETEMAAILAENELSCNPFSSHQVFAHILVLILFLMFLILPTSGEFLDFFSLSFFFCH